MIRLKTKQQIDTLRKGGEILARILRELSMEVRDGVSTNFLEKMARKKIEEAGAKPAFLEYTPKGASRPYPAALCVSVNDEIVHGIPNEKPKILKEGDIVSLDSGIEYEGMYTDSAITVGVGRIDRSSKKLILATQEALEAALEAAKPGNFTGDIGKAIEKVAKKYKLSCAEDLGGHGVGFSQHEDPFIPNHAMRGKGVELKAGMAVAIEPMLNLGGSKTRFLSDGYTAVTADGKKSAHFEHTVAITKEGADILTQ